MLLEDLKDKFIEVKEKIISFVQEDPSINSLKERYETLPSTGQKGLIAFLVFLVFSIMVYIPYTYFSTAKENEELYETYKVAIQNLLKVGRGIQGSTQTQRGNLEAVKNSMASSLENFRLVKDQIQGVTLNSETMGSLAKSPVMEETLIVRLNKLNLDQIVQIGTDLQREYHDLKMTGISISADTSLAGYFNTQFQFSKYFLPDSGFNENEEKVDESEGNEPEDSGNSDDSEGETRPSRFKKRFKK